MKKLSFSGTLFVVLASLTSVTAQENPFGKQIKEVFNGDVRIAPGTKLVLKEDLSEELDLRNGRFVRGARGEEPSVAVLLKQVVIDPPPLRKERVVLRKLARGSELVVTGIGTFRTGVNSGSYVIAIEAKYQDGSIGGVNLITSERSGGFMTAEQFKKAIGNIIEVKP